MKKNFSLILLIVLICSAVFYHLGRYGLFSWDEAIYANISQNVLKGNVFVLKWGDWQWFQKPPLYFWITAILYKIFGINEFSSRLLSALSGISLSYLIFLISQKLFNKKVALFSLLTILLNSFLLFQFRYGTTDIFALLLNTLAVYNFWLSQENKSNLLYSFIFLGLASLVKGPVVISIILFFVIYTLITGQFLNYLKSKFLWLGILIFCLIMLPWHLFMLNKFGSTFYNEYYIYQILKRAKEPIEGHYGTYKYYPKILLSNFPLALTLFFLPPILKNTQLLKKKRELLFVSLWLLIQYLSIEKVATKLPWYIIPVFIPLQILVAFTLSNIWSFKKNIGKIFICLTILLAIFTELWKPYYQWKELTLQSNNKDCLTTYKQMNQATYYALGYDNSLPTLLLYLDSTSISQINNITEVPPNNIVMVYNSYHLNTNYDTILKKEACYFVKAK